MGKFAGDGLDDLLSGASEVKKVEVVVPETAAKALEGTNGPAKKNDPAADKAGAPEKAQDQTKVEKPEVSQDGQAEKMVTLTIRFPASQYQKFRKERARRLVALESGDVSLGDIVRECVDLTFTQRESKDRNAAAAIARDDFDKRHIEKGE